MAESIPSLTVTRATGCGNCHVTMMLDGKDVKRISAKLGRSGTCASSMTSAIGKLASLAIKNGASLESVAKKIEGITCHHVVPTLGDEKGCTSCADAIAQVLYEFAAGKATCSS